MNGIYFGSTYLHQTFTERVLNTGYARCKHFKSNRIPNHHTF